MSTETKTIADFITEQHIGMAVERANNNPNMDDSADMSHWLCRFNHPDGRQMRVHFSMGSGHAGKAPRADEVLDCLASDAAGVSNAQSFDDWCAEYGYDTDSPKAEKIYNACHEQAADLETFLGSDAFKELLWNTERL
jgi:hypothetical protein